MPNRQNEYWSRVRDCQRWAIEAETEAERQSFLQMAQTWTQLALEEAASEFTGRALGEAASNSARIPSPARLHECRSPKAVNS
jgi:hypothetical protein